MSDPRSLIGARSERVSRGEMGAYRVSEFTTLVAANVVLSLGNAHVTAVAAAAAPLRPPRSAGAGRVETSEHRR
jgi:hypothetical protein